MNIGLFIGIGEAVMLLLAIIFGSISFFMKRSMERKQQRCIGKTEAKVVDIVVRRGQGSFDLESCGRCYFPVFEYNADGEFLRKTSNVGSCPSPYEVGQIVKIKYNPKKPTEIIIEEDKILKSVIKGFKIATWLIIIMGIIMGVIGAILIDKI